MLWLQDEIIVLLRIKLFNEQAGFSLAAMLDQSTKIGAPASEVVIHIDHRNACRFDSLFSRAILSASSGMKRANCFASGKSRSLITSTMIRAISDLSGALPCRSALVRRNDFRGVA